MFKINDNYLKLPGSYLFSTIAKKVAAYKEANPEKKDQIISLGIGDVTLPLAPAVIARLHSAVDEMAVKETFKGYAPDLGYEFLRSAIAQHDYKARGVDIAIDEIFISDGAKSDSGNIGDIFSVDNRIAVCDPVYPVYVDTNVMAGRAGDYNPATERFSNVIYMALHRNCRKKHRISFIFAFRITRQAQRFRRQSFRNGWIMPLKRVQ